MRMTTCCDNGTPVSHGRAGWLPRVPSWPVGVAHNPDPVSEVRGIDATSRNNKRDRPVPQRFKIVEEREEEQHFFSCKYSSETVEILCSFKVSTLHFKNARPDPHADEAINVFTNNPSGPDIGNDSEHFRPEVAVILRAASLPGN